MFCYTGLKTRSRTHFSGVSSERYLRHLWIIGSFLFQLKGLPKSHLKLQRNLATQTLDFLDNLLKEEKRKGKWSVPNDRTICLQELLRDDTRIFCSCLWGRSLHGTNWSVFLHNSVFLFYRYFRGSFFYSHKRWTEIMAMTKYIKEIQSWVFSWWKSVYLRDYGWLV